MKLKDFEHLPYAEYQAEAQKIRITKQDLIDAITKSGSKFACISLNDWTNLLKLKNEPGDIAMNNDSKTLITGNYSTYNDVKIYVDKNIDLGDIKLSNDENDFIRKTK